jgi:hypothetical protein
VRVATSSPTTPVSTCAAGTAASTTFTTAAKSSVLHWTLARGKRGGIHRQRRSHRPRCYHHGVLGLLSLHQHVPQLRQVRQPDCLLHENVGDHGIRSRRSIPTSTPILPNVHGGSVHSSFATSTRRPAQSPSHTTIASAAITTTLTAATAAHQPATAALTTHKLGRHYYPQPCGH